MRTKKLFAGILAGAMVVGCMVMPANADGSATTSTFTVQGTASYWDQLDVSSSDLLGSSGIATGAVTSITASSDATGTWALYWYDASGTWLWEDVSGGSMTFTVSTDLYNASLETLDWGGCFGIINRSGGDEQTYTFSVTYSDTYDTTLAYQIDEADLSASSYTVTLKNSDGDVAALNGNTYYVDSEGDYYIGVDVSDIPYNQTLTITDVTFN